MTYSAKSAIRTAAIFGWSILGCAASIEAQMPQDPYPAYGQASQAPAVTAHQNPIPGPVMQGPTVPNFSQPAVSYQTPSRSARLERIAQDADQHTRKAFGLASRGAYYSARAEFVRALRLVAQGLDSERQCRAYSQGARRGASKRWKRSTISFRPDPSLKAISRCARLLHGHQTTVLKHTLAQQPSPTFNSSLPNPAFTSGNHPHELSEFSVHIPTAGSLFAGNESPASHADGSGGRLPALCPKNNLSTAVGGEVAGSMALHGLGKLYAAQKETELDIAISRAIVCFQTAVTVCPQNYLARNDLGVLLAKSGRATDACRVFEESLAIHPDPTVMANLASVYRMLGKTHLLAETQKRLAAYQQSASVKSPSAPTVDWLTPERFSESYAYTPDARQLPPAQQANKPQAKPSAKQADRQADRSWPWSWMKR